MSISLRSDEKIGIIHYFSGCNDVKHHLSVIWSCGLPDRQSTDIDPTDLIHQQIYKNFYIPRTGVEKLKYSFSETMNTVLQS